MMPPLRYSTPHCCMTRANPMNYEQLQIAAGEQNKIAKLRIMKLLSAYSRAPSKL